MEESVYSKTLLKRFQNSLKEKTYENTYMRVLKDHSSLTRQQNEENDVSPMRKVIYDKNTINPTMKTTIKNNDSSLNEHVKYRENYCFIVIFKRILSFQAIIL